MSRSGAVGAELKYFCENHNASMGTSGNILFITQGKKETRALYFLDRINDRIKRGHEISIDVKDKSLKDIVDTIVAGCDAKVGTFQKIANVFFRFLSSLGFKRFTPTIDRIHQVAKEIRAVEFTSTGKTISFFKGKLDKIIEGFKSFPQAEAHQFFGPDLATYLGKSEPVTIKECIDRAKEFQVLVIKYETEHQRVNPYNEENAGNPSLFSSKKLSFYELEDLFLDVAKEAYNAGNLAEGADALSRVKYVNDRDKLWVENFVRDCLLKNDTQSALLALSRVYLYRDAWKLKLEVGMQILKKPEINEEDIRTALAIAKDIYLEDTTLGYRIINVCLPKKLYQWALSAAEDGIRYEQREPGLIMIVDDALRNNDLATASQAADKILLDGDKKAELFVVIAKRYLDNKDYDNAYNAACKTGKKREKSNELMYRIAGFCFNQGKGDLAKAARAIQNISGDDDLEYRIAAKQIFDACVAAKNYDAAFRAAFPIYKEEDIAVSLIRMARELLDTNHFPLAQRALNLIQLEKDKQLKEEYLKELKEKAPELFSAE